MKKLLLFTMLLLTGCATTYSPIPEDYAGPVSIIKSSEKDYTTSKADLFFVQKIDKKNIHNSLWATRSATQGQGFSLSTKHVDTKVPSGPAEFTIMGRTVYAAPIQALTNPVFEVSGNITFTPEPNTTYIVKGELGADYSAVWIEEKESGKVIQHKIETLENSELGFFEK